MHMILKTRLLLSLIITLECTYTDAFIHPVFVSVNSWYINNMHRYESKCKPCLHICGDTLEYLVTNY